MRCLFALLAVLVMLISPVTAVAAQEHCPMMGQNGMASMSMPMAQSASADEAQTDPCCDHGKQSTHNDEACAKACAAMCGVVLALPTSTQWTMTLGHTVFEAEFSDDPRAHSPPISERPPKLIA